MLCNAFIIRKMQWIHNFKSFVIILNHSACATALHQRIVVSYSRPSLEYGLRLANRKYCSYLNAQTLCLCGQFQEWFGSLVPIAIFNDVKTRVHRYFSVVTALLSGWFWLYKSALPPQLFQADVQTETQAQCRALFTVFVSSRPKAIGLSFRQHHFAAQKNLDSQKGTACSWKQTSMLYHVISSACVWSV